MGNNKRRNKMSMKKQTWKAAVSAAAIAATVAIPMAVNADTVTTNGVTWTYTVNNAANKTVTLGEGSVACIPTDATVDASNIPWTFMKDGEKYTVTALASSAFAYCTNMTGTLTIPMAVTSWGNGSCFRRCRGLTRVTSFGGYTGTGNIQGMFRECTGLTGVLVIPDEFEGGFGNYSFDACTNLTGIIVGSGTKQCNTCFASKKCTGSYAISSYTVSKLKGVWYKGRPDVTTGDQDYTKIIPGDQLREEIALKVVLIGKNTQPYGTGDMMVNVSGCKVFIPQNGKWIPGTTYANANNEVIWYGANTNLDLSVNTDLMQITAIPKTADMLVKVLEAAPIFKDVFGLEPRISVTNAIDLTGVTITDEMLSSVTFDRLMFSAKTQAQLNAILDAFPATTPISIDPTGLTENMVIPDGYPNVYVKTVPGVTVRRKSSGFIISVE